MTGEPFVHELIRASAGSGKTQQLTNRYLGLLAAGAEPEAILATTFTRKAAGEILDRVLDRLARAAGDVAAAGALASQIGREGFGPGEFTQLLRKLLHNLHRVRIGTLDSYYITLAGSFSLELGLPPGWTICEEADHNLLQLQALDRQLEGGDISLLAALYFRLTAGQTKRSVYQTLLNIVNSLYSIQQETPADAWQKITLPPALSPSCVADLLTSMQAFDLSKHTRMSKPRDSDVKNAQAGQWLDLFEKGLAGKVFTGENTYFNKPIPEDLVGLYSKLLDQARFELLRPLQEQNKATREFLDSFAVELFELKQATGWLRFDEVTQALVDALAGKGLPAQAMAFRLDGAVDHLLLDEFQDTSLAQWRVLVPIARAITREKAQPPRSFFCVGDTKQAIYGWRGGMAEILNTLPAALGPLQERPLLESRRSAQPIIDVVNRVFSNLGDFDPDDKFRDGIVAWAKRFEQHTTFKKADPGFVRLAAGPAQLPEQGLADQRVSHFQWVAKQIQVLTEQQPGRSIGVLCRKKATIGRLIFELRQLKVDASEEGGNPLTDSAGVELVLSLFTLADHPEHSIAWFHLTNSPLKEHLGQFNDADPLAARLRSQLAAEGHGRFTHAWASRIAPACDRRELSRLQQLVEMAYDYQPRSTLRADDFVAHVRQKRVPDPSAANVRVMTMHGAKGLQFDTVVLPELDSELLGMAPAFVVRRDEQTLDVNLVCRYAAEAMQNLLAGEERLAFEQDRQQRVEESLSLLYVAMTRAVHALYLFIPGPRNSRSVRKDAWYELLRQMLAPAAEWKECQTSVEHGDANWFKHVQAPPQVVPPTESRPSITFRTEPTQRRRGLKHLAPSGREGKARVALNHLFHPYEGTGTAAGTLYHAWFATIGWLDEGQPTEELLRRAAEKIRVQLPAPTWRELDRLLAIFRTWLQHPAIKAALSRSAYVKPDRAGFPRGLAQFWNNRLTVASVEQERRFLVQDGATFWNGSFDRVVWLAEGDRIVAADVLDFKTDALVPGDETALTVRTDHYRPQLEAYRDAVARLAGLPAERVSARLLFTCAGKVVDI